MNIRTLALATCAMFAITASAMDSLERDLATLDFMCEKKAQGSHGFQGCVNKANCGETGYYLEQYSAEGLCEKCELNKFAERFVTCLFCRKPTKKVRTDLESFSCHGCKRAIEKALVDQLKVSDEVGHIQVLQKAAFRCLAKSKYIARKYIPNLIDDKTYHHVFDDSSGLHYYLGAQHLEDGSIRHVWSKELKIGSSEKKMVIKSDEAELLMQDICDRYNLFGPETGTPLEKLPAEDLIFYNEAQ